MIQELEEAAAKFYKEYPTNPLDKPEWHYNRDVDCFKKRKAFINGAKWQQERMYSEEDLRNAYRWGTTVNHGTKEHFNEWFEQFKKK
jgi:hypothetical protein